METEWLGSVDNCCLCETKLVNIMYDANFNGMGWGLFCDDCFKKFDLELGVGKGQQYIFVKSNEKEEGKWVLVR